MEQKKEKRKKEEEEITAGKTGKSDLVAEYNVSTLHW